MAEFAKMSIAINLRSKYSQGINNIDMNAAENLKLISIKKYQKYINHIQNKIDWLYKNEIPAFRAFVKHF